LIKLVADDAAMTYAENAGLHEGADLLVATCLPPPRKGTPTRCSTWAWPFRRAATVECDLIEAHKWFNLAAVGGHDDAAQCRADISEEMTAREIAEAQRRAREWIRASSRRAA
jgi:peptidoglycan/xylan/chitin deacetylase (PgdA/CDA1 family)